MRSFEQRRAEILRRSEKRLQKRKQLRRGLATACVPAVLCLGLFLPEFTGYSQPATLTVSTENILADVCVTAVQSSTVEFREETDETTVVEVTVLLNGISCFADNGETAEQIALLLQQIQSEPEGIVSNESADCSQSERHHAYQIVLRDEEEQVFYWTGTSLADQVGGIVYILTAQQLAALEEYTGIH